MTAAALLARWRAETPGVGRRNHLNNAGAGLMPAPVVEALQYHLILESQIGGYEAADLQAEQIASTYRSVAELIGTTDRHVAIVENATVAVAQALSSFDFEPGDVVITSRADYVSNQLMLLSLAERRGIRIARAADRPEGGVDPDSVAQLAKDPRARLVMLTWIPTNSGLIQDVEAVGDICARHDLPYLVDGCQALGQLSIDVARLRCDFLAATARKFLRGPRGIGTLYVGERVLAARRYPLLLDLRGGTWTDADRFEPAPDARRFENWEFGYAQVVALGMAARYALEAQRAGATARTAALGTLARERFGALNGVRILDRGARLGALVTMALDGLEPAAAVTALRQRGINTSVFPRAAAVIDMDDKGVSAGLRVSPHYYNTEAEIESAAAALGELLDRTR